VHNNLKHTLRILLRSASLCHNGARRRLWIEHCDVRWLPVDRRIPHYCMYSHQDYTSVQVKCKLFKSGNAMVYWLNATWNGHLWDRPAPIQIFPAASLQPGASPPSWYTPSSLHLCAGRLFSSYSPIAVSPRAVTSLYDRSIVYSSPIKASSSQPGCRYYAVIKFFTTCLKDYLAAW